jgi:uncharacterized membrane protein YqaE (UPF0057 family)
MYFSKQKKQFMKSIAIKTLAVAMAVFIMVSCSVEKRRYTSGYSVSWKHSKGNVSTRKMDLGATNKPASAGLAEVATVVNEVKTAEVNAGSKEIYASAAKGTVKAPRQITRAFTVNNISSVNHIKYGVGQKAILKAAVKSAEKSADISPVVYIILCILIPFVAVGLATDWGIEVVYNLLWMLLCGFPAIIHAFIVCKRLGKL